LQPRVEESGHYSDIQSIFAGRDQGSGDGDGGTPGRGMVGDDPYHYIDIDRLRNQSRIISTYANDGLEQAEGPCFA